VVEVRLELQHHLRAVLVRNQKGVGRGEGPESRRRFEDVVGPLQLRDLERYAPDRFFNSDDFEDAPRSGRAEVAEGETSKLSVTSQDGTQITYELQTETRVVATDVRTRLHSVGYWLLIRAGSGLIRRDILRAIARRAEVSSPAPL